MLFAAFWSFPSVLGQMTATGLSDEEFGTTSVLKKEGEGLWRNIFIPFVSLKRQRDAPKHVNVNPCYSVSSVLT